jgi:type VI secretion system protein ImpA
MGGDALIQPISADRPCGENLEDTALLASFDAFRVFGHSTLPAPFGTQSKPGEPQATWPDWNQVRTRSAETLTKTKDLRVLAHLAAAFLRTDGLVPFLDMVSVSAQWLEQYPKDVYPLIDEDGIVRRSAFNCFADPFAVIDTLRRQPMVNSRAHGTFTLRDIEIASGAVPPPKGEAPPDKERLAAAFAEMALDELVRLADAVAAALAGVKRIETVTLETVGPDAVPSFEVLTTALTRMDKFLRGERATRGNGHAEMADPQADPTADSQEAGAPIMMLSSIKTRQDAVRALDAVSEYFQQYEPSSPVPLIIERAKRLVSKSFLEVLADIAPDAVAQARNVGGVKQS